MAMGKENRFYNPQDGRAFTHSHPDAQGGKFGVAESISKKSVIALYQ